MHCCMKQKIHDIDDLRKRLMQTWFNFDQDITEAPFTRYNLLSNRLSNPFDNRFDKTAVSCIQPVVKPVVQPV